MTPKKQLASMMTVIAVIMSWLSSCTMDSSIDFNVADNAVTRSQSCEKDSTLRLHFEDEQQLFAMISSSNDGETENNTRASLPVTTTPSNFVSLVSPINGISTNMTYYESLGYDSLVPNVNFAKLLNIQGEMEVRDNIVKITPAGTFIVKKEYEKQFRQWLTTYKAPVKAMPGTKYVYGNGMVQFIKTFGETSGDYSLVSEGNYTDLPEDEEDQTDYSIAGNLTRASVPEPCFNDFATFSADKKTVFGKLIQNLIGSTKSHKVNFHSKKRLKGSFYFYNYGVYSETGVSGWTDYKRKLNWTKTKNDEIRIGWRNVILELPTTSEYNKAIKKDNVQTYYPPKTIDIGKKSYEAAQIIDINLPSDFIEKVAQNGINYVKNYARQHYEIPNYTELNKATAFIIADSEKIYMITPDDNVVKYNDKYYCHTFSEEWMVFQVDVEWTNNKGVKVNGEDDIFSGAAKFIYEILTQKHPSLVSGEVYVCARFGNDWRGMKIIKNFKK